MDKKKNISVVRGYDINIKKSKLFSYSVSKSQNDSLFLSRGYIDHNKKINV